MRIKSVRRNRILVLIVLSLFILCPKGLAQTTESPAVEKSKPKYLNVVAVQVTPFWVAFTVDMTNGFLHGASWLSLSKNMVLTYFDKKSNQEVGIPVSDAEGFDYSLEKWFSMDFNRKYRVRDFGAPPINPMVKYYFTLIHGPLPQGLDLISIKENVSRGFKWENVHILPVNNHWNEKKNVGSKDNIKEYIENSHNQYAGIYKNLNDTDSPIYAFFHYNGKYVLAVYEKGEFAAEGAIVAELSGTAYESFFTGTFFDYRLQLTKDINILFDKGLMTLKIEKQRDQNFVRLAL